MISTAPVLRHRSCKAALLLLALLGGGPTACGDPLEVDDATAILDDELSNAEGAQLLRRHALRVLFDATSKAAWEGGLLTDEFLYQLPAFYEASGAVTPEELTDRRDLPIDPAEYPLFESYLGWQQLWTRAVPAAVAKLQAHAPPGARDAHVGEMFALRGFAALRLAEDFCPGFPLHTAVDYTVTYGPPLSTEQAFEHALAAFDSAVNRAVDSARILNFARVGQARALLGLGRFADAAMVAAAVPTGYRYEAQYSNTLEPRNRLADQPTGNEGWGVERSVADREGGTGLDFVSARDPRVKTDSLGTSRNGAIGLYGIAKYPSRATPIVLASGIEARLIEAEAALKADQPQWLTILNQLRQAQVSPALADTTDPGTDSARLDLLFRERAFWLFATGHRLGDLRRLVRHYNRASESVFPRGTYWRSDTYGSSTSLPFSSREVRFSPGVTGCTDS